MIGSCGNYRAMRAEAATASRAAVSQRQFLSECMASGMDREKSLFQLKIIKAMGGSVLIGGKMLSIKAKRKVAK